LERKEPDSPILLFIGANNMEILVFGLIAMRNGYRQPQETFVREPDEFHPFEVRALAHLYNGKNDTSGLLTDPKASLRAQVAS
jgi:hypothetical protein